MVSQFVFQHPEQGSSQWFLLEGFTERKAKPEGFKRHAIDEKPKA